MAGFTMHPILRTPDNQPVVPEAGRAYLVLQSRVLVHSTHGGIGGTPKMIDQFQIEYTVIPEEQ